MKELFLILVVLVGLVFTIWLCWTIPVFGLIWVGMVLLALLMRHPLGLAFIIGVFFGSR